MLIDRVVAPYFATNCWIVASGTGSECIVVDPGTGRPDLTREIMKSVKSHGLKPVGILITHGHLDHTFSVLPLAKEAGISTAYIHREDRELLTHPSIALGEAGLALLNELAPTKVWQEPDRVVEVDDQEVVEIAGLEIEIIHAPGHTRGSVMFKVNNSELLSGDVLFKGAIGRTDLPTGSPLAMKRSLRDKVLTLPDEIHVLPGHGDDTTIGVERASNPYLLEVAKTAY